MKIENRTGALLTEVTSRLSGNGLTQVYSWIVETPTESFECVAFNATGLMVQKVAKVGTVLNMSGEMKGYSFTVQSAMVKSASASESLSSIKVRAGGIEEYKTELGKRIAHARLEGKCPVWFETCGRRSLSFIDQDRVIEHPVDTGTYMQKIDFALEFLDGDHVQTYLRQENIRLSDMFNDKNKHESVARYLNLLDDLVVQAYAVRDELPFDKYMDLWKECRSRYKTYHVHADIGLRGKFKSLGVKVKKEEGIDVQSFLTHMQCLTMNTPITEVSQGSDTKNIMINFSE